jgi:uncharacterized sporulation protein YeaH/YhbH (DUF444 family)
MVRRIEQDHFRFREIVRGKIKTGLKKYISKGELLGRVGKKTVSVPIPQIELPRFKFDTEKQDGVGSGNGEPGDPVGDPQDGDGSGEAGEGEGQHPLEVEVELEELAKILGEELELPNIKPRGQADVESRRDKFTGIRNTGPESLRHMKRTYKRALGRYISQGNYDPENPIITPIPDDRRYRAWKVEKKPEYSAAIIYMMDVSGSMGAEQKEVVRITAFWLDLWLRHQYKNLETAYIVHDASAKEVDQHTFFHLRESGGTKISSAYNLCRDIIDERFGGDEWNIYPFHFSDGDNWSGKDSAECVRILRDEILPKSNQFCYGQVKSAYGSGQFKRDLDQHFEDSEDLVTSGIPDRNGILESIRDFLGKGR